MRELEKKPCQHGDASDSSDLFIYRPNETRHAKLEVFPLCSIFHSV